MNYRLTTAALCAGLALAPWMASAQKKSSAPPLEYNSNTWSQADATRIVQEVRHRLLTLTNYNVFDSLSFGIQ
jgi:hypothetical protein